LRRTIIAVIAVIVVIAMACLGAWYLRNPSKPYTGTPEPITIGVTTLPGPSGLIYIADEQHFFTDNGLDVTINGYDAGLYAVEDMMEGKNDIAVAAEFVIVGKALQRENISSVGTIGRSQDQYIVGRKDHGIVSSSDLAGKKIGVTRGTIPEFYLGRYLELHGISLRNVTLVDLNSSQQAVQIGNGTVDAIVGWGPNVESIMDQLGPNAVRWPVQSGQLTYWNAICSNDWVVQHPELIKRFLKSLDQAAVYAINHPAEAKTIVKERLRVDDAYIDTVWPGTHFSLSIDQAFVTAMEDESRWMIKNNLTAERTIPDYRDYLYLKGLDEVKPQSVNIII